MEYTKSVFEARGGYENKILGNGKPITNLQAQETRYEYKILVGGKPVIVQDFKPGVEGWQIMTRDEAEQFAEELIRYFRSCEETT